MNRTSGTGASASLLSTIHLQPRAVKTLLTKVKADVEYQCLSTWHMRHSHKYAQQQGRIPVPPSTKSSLAKRMA